MRRQQLLKEVFLIRHGQSVDNASPVFQAADSPLSKKGLVQAEMLADRLRPEKLDALITSPLPRAFQTAEFISKSTGLKPITSELFVERVKPHETDGQPWTNLIAAKKFLDWEKSLFDPKLRVSDGENYDDIIQRAQKALRYLEERPEERIVVVTHGFFMRTVIAVAVLGDTVDGRVLKKFHRNLPSANTSVTSLRYLAYDDDTEPAWRLWSYNDVGHL